MRTFTINDKRISFYSSASTEKQAIKEIEKQMLEYQEKKEKGLTFEEVTEEWQEYHYKSVTYATAQRYDLYVNALIDYFGNRYIKNITAIEIEHFMNYMSVRGYSTKTIRDQLSVTKMIFKYAIIHQYIDNDVSAYISAAKGIPPKKREALTEEEVAKVNDSIDCTFGLLAYFLLYTGLRKGEALALQWKDIDFDNKLIHIYKSVYYEGNRPCIKSPKTQAGKRTVILLDCIMDKLSRGSPNDYVFGCGSSPMRKTYFSRQWEKYKNECGLNITAHQLRHTYATMLFEANISQKDAQTLMGHSDIKVTQNIYTHIRNKRMPETAEKLNGYIAVRVLSNTPQ